MIGGLGFGADGHPPSRAERQQRNRKSLTKLIQMIVVRRYAVAAVPIKVQSNAVERHFKTGADAAGRVKDGVRDPIRRRVEPEMADEARDIELAVVHLATHGSPGHGGAKLGEPGRCNRRIDESGRVRDAPAFVVGKQLKSGLKERELHISLSQLFGALCSSVSKSGQLKTPARGKCCAVS